MKKTIIFVSFAAFLLSGCFGGGNQEQKWTSKIFPDKENTKRHKKFGIYNSLEECRKASLDELKTLGLSNRGDYQCGLNCEFHEGMKLDICEKLDK